MTNFNKHANQPAHRRAMNFISGKSQDAECVPDLSEFASVRQNIMDGHTGLQDSKRKYKVAWCLYQAIKIRDIAALKHARMICLF